jgi:hypothetical protein
VPSRKEVYYEHRWTGDFSYYESPEFKLSGEATLIDRRHFSGEER